MTALIVAAIVVGSVLTYCLVAGLVYGRCLAWRTTTCSSCRNSRSCYSDHDMGAFFCGMFWPIAVPVLLGQYWSDLEGNRAARADAVAKRIAKLEKELGLR